MTTIEQIAQKHTDRLDKSESDYSEFEKPISNKDQVVLNRRAIEDHLEMKKLNKFVEDWFDGLLD